MMNKKTLPANPLSAALVAATILIAGCSADPVVPTAPGTTGNASLSNFQPTTDIPIPSGARFDARQSLVLSGKDYWTGRLVLDANPDISQIFAFYQQEMPPLGWEPVASVLSTTSVLTFIRQNRTATVQIVPQRWGGSKIAVTVATRQPGQPGGVVPAAGGNLLPPMSPAGFGQGNGQPAPGMPLPPPPDAGQAAPASAPNFQQQIPQVYSQQPVPNQTGFPLR
ncbi:MAG TPA: hypothetical protein DCS82_06375 [Rhodospirillaceae bacterium]|nr:hypothetical protein [Rhodospirillaceae bacterium]HAT35323.1 hypothetical protein [Rhodospirillaceae bacterium]|tara:strand:- start:450 stop:1121 length:672 start_codon:yes stop_codon:yes gene_type:complete